MPCIKIAKVSYKKSRKGGSLMFTNQFHKMAENGRQSNRNMLCEITSAYTDIGGNGRH